MTTAHRPTWKAAVARASETTSGVAYTTQSVLDVATHTKLKVRTTAPSLEDRSKSDIVRASLLKLKAAEDKLKSHAVTKRVLVKEVEEEGRRKLLKQTADIDEERLLLKYDDKDEDERKGDGNGGGEENSYNKKGGSMWSDAGNDSGDGSSDLDDSDSSDEDSSDEEDEEALLQAELARIRAEREDVKAKEEQAKMEEETSKMEEEALVGNPLINTDTTTSATLASGKLKRRWNDDVVFRNQAKYELQQNNKRFINDTVRNDFHKRFLYKFIR